MSNAQAFVFASFLCLVLSAFALITIPSQGNDTLESFILARRRLKQGTIVASLTGTNAALANIVFLFAYWGFTYGGAGLVWGCVFWVAGLTLFLVALRWGGLAQLLRPDQKALGINEILGGKFRKSRLATAAISIATGLTFLFLLSLEVGVGSNAAIRLISDAPAASYGFSHEALLIGGALVILVSAYGYVGGFPMVVRTDIWQLVLIVAGLSSALVLCDQTLSAHETNLLPLLYHEIASADYFEWSWRLAPFVLGSLFSWSVWFLCTADSWQRALAADPSEPRRIRPAAIFAGMFLLVGVSAASAAIGITMKHVWAAATPPAYPVIEFVALVKSTVGSTEMGSILMSLMMAGFLAAMASTVDTYMVIIGQSWGGDLVRSQPLSTYVGTPEEGKVLGLIRMVGIVTPIVGLAGFALIHIVGQQNNFTLYMLAGSLPMSLVPISAWAVWGHRQYLPEGKWASVGILLAIIASLAANYAISTEALSSFSDRAFGLLYFVPAGTAAIAAAFLILDLQLSKRKNLAIGVS